MTDKQKHPCRCDNGCIRKMDAPMVGEGDFAFYKGTLDCPAQLNASDIGDCEGQLISSVGCCEFRDGHDIKTRGECWMREGQGDSAECGCHNTRIVYATCLSKINHGACPFGLKMECQEKTHLCDDR